MAQLAVSAVGAAIGFAIGGPAGAQWGWMAGSMIGSAFVGGHETQGPRLSDLKVSGTDYGQTIPWVAGSPRISGQVVWASEKREIATTESAGGKGGGPEYTSYTYEVDVLYLLTENVIGGVSRIWSNGDLVFGGLVNKEGVWADMVVYTGAANQLPDPTYEADVGVGNAPAYRGRGLVMIKSLQLGSGGQLPNLTFEVGAATPDSDVKLLLHFDPGASGLNAYNDSSIYNHQVNHALDGTDISSSDGIHGRLFVPGNGAAKGVFIAGDDIMKINSSEFTFEFFFTQPEDIGKYIRLVEVGYSGNVGGYFNFLHGKMDASTYYMEYSFSFEGYGAAGGALTYPNTRNFWPRHFCMMRHLNQISVFINGMPVLLVQLTSSNPVSSLFGPGNITQQGIWLGGHRSSAGSLNIGHDVYYDELKLTHRALYSMDGFSPPSIPLPLDVVWNGSKTPENLIDVIDRLMSRAGYFGNDYSVNNLSLVEYPLRGFAVGNVSSTRSALEALQKSWFLDCVASDKIYIKPRSTAVAAVIPFSDIGGSEDDPLTLTMCNDLEVPAQIAISYPNMESDYNISTENSDRLLSGQQTTLSMQLPIGMLPAEAKRAADKFLLDQVTSMTKASITVPLKYACLEPGDLIDVSDQAGRTYRLRIQTKRDNLTHLQLECLLDDVQSLVSESITDTGYTGSTGVAALAQTTLIPLDIPLLRDVDDAPGFYIAVAPASADAWAGAAIYNSWDGINYTSILTSSAACTIGTCLTTLPSWSGAGFDETSQLTVVTNKPLSGSTVAAMDNDPSINVLLVGSEIIRFVNAQLSGTNTYTLSKLVRGYRGTEWAIGGHVAGEACVLLNSNIRRITDQAGDLNRQRSLKAATLGSLVANASVVTFTDQAICLKPFSVSNLAITPATGTSFSLSWTRRSRLSSPAAPLSPIAEGTVESYYVEVYKGATKLTTLTVNGSTSCTFNASGYGFATNDKVKFVVYQHGTVHDKGYPASIEGTYQ